MKCLYWHQQEVFDARYLKVPQQPESNFIPTQQHEKGKEYGVESASTSNGSESENLSESNSSSEKMAVQLASLEKRVGIYIFDSKLLLLLLSCSWVKLRFLAFQLKVVSAQLQRLTKEPQVKPKKKDKLTKVTHSQEKDSIRRKHKSSKCKSTVQKMADSKGSILYVSCS